MKKMNFKTFAIISGFVFLMIIPAFTSAQPFGRGEGRGFGPGNGPSYADKGEDCRIPSLTEDQKTSIEKLRTAHLRKASLIRAEIGEKQARMNTLRLAEKQDVKAIDQTIDEISKLKGDLMKEREAHKREVRSLLNDEQKTVYDSRQGRGFRDGKDYRAGRSGKGEYGRGPGRGECIRY
ncbi:MAG: periplasmic heavy metal sensor [Lentimicrobium sp.]|nr:periplasmic heavy metal sensor [Lentimicrobium sp.]